MDPSKAAFVEMQMHNGNNDYIEVGDLVQLLPTATYRDGRIIPSWVKQDRWIVDRIDANRNGDEDLDVVIINKNESGTHAIQSPVFRKNLRKA